MKALANADEVGAAAVDYLRVVGHLVFAWLFARSAQIALERQKAQGMTLADARAIAPDLLHFDYEPDRAQKTLSAMGIGPIEAIPAALKSAGLTKEQLDWIELNEAFAAQSLAVLDSLELDRSKVNPMGGAIALGHPLGATGAIRTATVVHALRRRNLKYGMVTMCVGTGQGAAGIFERV